MANGGTVYGAFTDKDTGELLENGSASCPDSHLTLSSGNGAYSGTTSVDNDYAITGSAPGYQDKTHTVTLANSNFVGQNFQLEKA